MSDQALAIYRRRLREAIAAAKLTQTELGLLYTEVANDVRARIGDGSRDALRMQRAIDRAFEKTIFKRVSVIGKAVNDGAQRGPVAARETFRETFQDEATRAQVRASPAALSEAADRIAGRVTVDGVRLSRRIRKWDAKLSGEMARTIQQSVVRREGILQAAARIEAIDATNENLPRYLQEVEALARGGDAKELRAVAKGYLKRTARILGERQPGGAVRASPFSLRAPTQRFLRDIQKAGKAEIDQIVARYVKDKAEYRARVIARHETVEAYRRSYLSQIEGKPGVHGVRWTLSGRHPVPDECDVFANQNAHGLGPGIYPVDKVPSRHTSCICALVAWMDEKHFDRPAESTGVPEEMRDRSSPDAVGWMVDNTGLAQKILGPTRWAAFKRGDTVLDALGRPLPVAEVLARGAQAAE